MKKHEKIAGTNSIDGTVEDELRPEYDLKSLRVRKVGPARTSFGGQVVRLAPDVAAVFPDAESVNEALRFLIRVTRENNLTLTKIVKPA